MYGWRAIRIVALASMMVACAPGSNGIEHSETAIPADSSREYDLDCGEMDRGACEEAAAEFVADLRESDPDVVVVSVSVPFPDTLDATLSDGTHVTTTLEPEASDD